MNDCTCGTRIVGAGGKRIGAHMETVHNMECPVHGVRFAKIEGGPLATIPAAPPAPVVGASGSAVEPSESELEEMVRLCWDTCQMEREEYAVVIREWERIRAARQETKP